MVNGPNRHGSYNGAEDTKPEHLIPGGCNIEFYRCPKIIPHSIVVTCNHMELVRTGVKICVICLPAYSGILPIPVYALQAIAEMNSLWNRQTQGCIRDLDVSRMSRKVEVSQWGVA